MSINLQQSFPIKSALTELCELMEMTPERIEEIENAEFLYEKLIPKGLITVIAAPPNGGKTTIMMHIASTMAKNGLDVTYIDYDSSAIHIKEYFETITDKSGFKYWTELNGDIDSIQIVDKLLDACKKEGMLSDCIFIFDTLKKFTNLMSKQKVAEFMGKMRRLTQLGATVILLAHTNKRTESSGTYMFEGVGDVKNDCDNLFYFVPTENSDKTITVSVDVINEAKKKAPIEPCTFMIHADRTVTILEKSVSAEDLMSSRRDSGSIEVICQIIDNREINESELVNNAIERGISRRLCKKILKSYDGYWKTRKGEKNATLYSLAVQTDQLVKLA